MDSSFPAALKQTDFKLPGLVKFYRGKVRDMYFFENKIAAVATDRISAFDHILPSPIPSKGRVLNQMAAWFLDSCSDIVPIWLEDVPDPNVSAGKKCRPVKIEMVVRGYLAGHAWRLYKDGHRSICDVGMPEGMVQSERFPEPIVTPSTKADEGHDEDISREAILSSELVDEETYLKMEEITFKLFQRGQSMAEKRGLVLVDTKYEFGLDQNGMLTLIDEVHTPDSSRYFIAEEYEHRLKKGLPQKHLSKEFVREWLMENGFQGKQGDAMPDMSDKVIAEIRNKYIDLYERMTGRRFKETPSVDIEKRVEANLLSWCRKGNP
ncbi:MAG: phosphoribosylaminoimidazolesuccinocarboxamide synthase [Saprospirales bacterium]|nr:MAG: phosphoribosylaminoimidazolesuccinocarboxamide synthase [Saprospirales bacterium]